MSKRFFPQQHGDRKRVKLDVSISDHNFPLSQNKEPDQLDNWGDDNDDEILLLASQACEEVYNNDLSMLPDYSMFMQPGSSSTQMNPLPGPSTSKEFNFKKPSVNPTCILSTNLKEKCDRISSPLPGITAHMMPKASIPDNSTFSDKIYKGQDSDQLYRQLLQLQEQNEKLKSENGKLLEKCVTKEGEASILRTQLKTYQVSVDNARLEKIKTQEKVQMEWTDKLAKVNTQLQDLRTQLDFKNLEIISIKEKCKKLESTKVKLTQVTVANNDISTSHRSNSSFTQNDSTTHRRVKTSTIAAQTDHKSHFLTLCHTLKTEEPTKLSLLLPLILEPTIPPHSILEYNEKLVPTDSPHRCVYTTFQKVPSNGIVKGNVHLSTLYEDIVTIVNGCTDDDVYFNIFKAVYNVMAEVLAQLETLKQRTTSAFQKQMDEAYIETSSHYIDVCRQDLLRGKALYKEEQEIQARRIIAIFSYLLEIPITKIMHRKYEKSKLFKGNVCSLINEIIKILDYTCCGTIYSGLLQSTTHIVQSLSSKENTIEYIKLMISVRPHSFVCVSTLLLVTETADSHQLCPNNSAGNLKTDYDQGVLLYKRDSCYLQILLKQIEVALKCIERLVLGHTAVSVTRLLLRLARDWTRGTYTLHNDRTKCECVLILVQVCVYALRICADMCQKENGDKDELVSLCGCGIRVLYQFTLRDVEFSSQLGYYEGHLIQFCEVMRTCHHNELYVNMLSELSPPQPSAEDSPPSFHSAPWIKSLHTFSIAD